ncbi:MAG: bifunctional diaminohydroxyphosphoribosylaminopyrimidine deaminase/5-amino-6-(5-phosphoribosylamino)uracil reductase RibD [Pseudomonadota bacterium]
MNEKTATLQDKRFLDAALRLARKHQGLTGTNPSVGCVIVSQTRNGPVIVGSAVTARGGRPHAEPPALAEAGDRARGATAYVTLEPCAHHGKTPPCAQALIDAGIKRVVTAIVDPDNRVNGQGHGMLRAANVDVLEMDGGEFANRVIQGYLKVRSGFLPFVTLKLAMDEHGLIGSRKTGNLKISCAGSMLQTHLTRARHDAILVGSGTAIADNPMLTCRLPGMQDRSPVRVVLDEACKLNETYNVISTAQQFPTWLVGPAEPTKEWKSMIVGNGIQHLPAEMHNDRVALPELFADLAAKGIQSVMVEGGAKLAESLLADDLVDEIIVHQGETLEDVCQKENAIYASFKPDCPPDGFTVVQKLRFGSDHSLRMRKLEA